MEAIPIFRASRKSRSAFDTHRRARISRHTRARRADKGPGPRRSATVEALGETTSMRIYMSDMPERWGYASLLGEMGSVVYLPGTAPRWSDLGELGSATVYMPDTPPRWSDLGELGSATVYLPDTPPRWSDLGELGSAQVYLGGSRRVARRTRGRRAIPRMRSCRASRRARATLPPADPPAPEPPRWGAAAEGGAS